MFGSIRIYFRIRVSTVRTIQRIDTSIVRRDGTLINGMICITVPVTVIIQIMCEIFIVLRSITVVIYAVAAYLNCANINSRTSIRIIITVSAIFHINICWIT